MANAAFTFGLLPIYNGNGNERAKAYTLKTGSTVYRGDVVMMDATGTVTPITNGATSICFGVALEYVDDSGSAGGKTVLVCDDLLNTQFLINCKSTSAATEIAVTDVFTNLPIYLGAGVVQNSGTAYVSGISGYYADIDNVNAATTTLPLRVMGLYDSPDNAWGKNAKIIVKFNNQATFAGTAGV